MNKDQLAARLLVTFLGELDEQVQALNRDLLALETDGNAERVKSLFRVAHTLKGAARAAGVAPVEEACHALESLLAQAREDPSTLGPDEFRLLFAAADALADAHHRLTRGEELATAPISTLPDRLSGRTAPTPGRELPDARGPGPGIAPVRGEGHVRVDAEKIDALLAATGHLVIANDRVARLADDIDALHTAARRCASVLGRASRDLRVVLGRSGTPPALLQAVSSVEEGLRDLVQVAARSSASATGDARAAAQVTAEVADRARQLRMRPFAEACEALPRAVRDLASTAGKEVDLEIAGGDVQVDRAVLDGLREPLLHLVRNAVDHGIEVPAERRKAGKPWRGTVSVAATLSGDRVRVTVSDDGAGVDTAGVRAALARRGATVPTSDRELARTLLGGGFSSRAQVTAISGRGVGLDIVRDAAERIRAGVEVTWDPGHGTTFTLECPPSLATIRALLARVGPQVVAVPTAEVERCVRVRDADIKHAEGREVVEGPEGPIPLVALATLLPPLVGRPLAPPLAVVRLQAGDRRLAIAVDELVAEQEIVLRPVGRRDSCYPTSPGRRSLRPGRWRSS